MEGSLGAFSGFLGFYQGHYIVVALGPGALMDSYYLTTTWPTQRISIPMLGVLCNMQIRCHTAKLVGVWMKSMGIRRCPLILARKALRSGSQDEGGRHAIALCSHHLCYACRHVSGQRLTETTDAFKHVKPGDHVALQSTSCRFGPSGISTSMSAGMSMQSALCIRAVISDGIASSSKQASKAPKKDLKGPKTASSLKSSNEGP